MVFMENELISQYMRIALDIASRILSGELEEHRKISGRSLLSSEYNVSPETIRKAIKLLSDMKVVETKEKSGIVILSRDNAKRYIDSFHNRHEQQQLRIELKELMEEYNTISKKLFSVYDKLISSQQNPLPFDKTLPNYEVKIQVGSDKIGKNLSDLHFWQATGATIIAIRRNKNDIISPGPYAELYEGDIIVFVGLPDSVYAVNQFLNGTITT